MPARGFTLIELMVGISIVAILATIGIVSYSQAQEGAKKSRVLQDFQSIEKHIYVARESAQKTLLQRTGSACTHCGCRYSNVNNCLTAMTASWNKITANPLPKDPWGGIYTFDENEGEGGQGDCRPDTIVSAGKDGILMTADDYIYEIGLKFCTAVGQNCEWSGTYLKRFRPC